MFLNKISFLKTEDLPIYSPKFNSKWNQPKIVKLFNVKHWTKLQSEQLKIGLHYCTFELNDINQISSYHLAIGPNDNWT